jgi:hypothetical protein
MIKKVKVIHNVIKSNNKVGSHFFKLKKTVAIVAIACSLAVVAMIGNQLIKGNGDTTKLGQYQALFRGFVLTAYAEDGTPVEVKPNVNFLLGKYQLTMSSVPGLPIKIAYDEADTIQLKAGYGTLKLWTGAEVLDAGNSIEIKSGDTIYWSPIPDKNNDTAPIKSIVEITAYQNNKILGNSTIEIIKSDDNISYNGILKQE